jgi:hypothetical protein
MILSVAKHKYLNFKINIRVAVNLGIVKIIKNNFSCSNGEWILSKIKWIDSTIKYTTKQIGMIFLISFKNYWANWMSDTSLLKNRNLTSLTSVIIFITMSS